MPDADDQGRQAKKSTPRTIREYTESLAIAFILAMIIRHYVVEAFKIPTGSMEPTLMGDPWRGDKILVCKFMYDISKPERWDVFVFKFPREPEKNYIKRLAGLPGETIGVHHGDLHVNGKISRKPPKVQAHLWRAVTDERQALSQMLLRELNRLEARLLRGGLSQSERYEPYLMAGGSAASWYREVRNYEFEAQLRQLENGVKPRNLWRKCRSGSAKRVKRHLREIAAATGTRGTAALKRWYDGYLSDRKDIDAQLTSHVEQLLADRDELLARAMRWFWKTEPGVEVGAGGRLVMDASANPVGAVRASYSHAVRDGRFNNNLEQIVPGVAPDTFWQRRYGQPRYVVGDLRLTADIEPQSDPAEATVTLGEDGAQFVCRIRRNGQQLSFDLEAFGAPTTVDTVTVPYSEAPCQVDFANVDDQLLLCVDGRFRARFEFEAPSRNATRSSAAAIACHKGKIAVDNVGLYRDVYYIRRGEYLMANNSQVHLGQREYFALGDNSPSSNDSRMWGVVPEENLVGEAFLVIWPIPRLRIIR